jgi:hypothetical protein
LIGAILRSKLKMSEFSYSVAESSRSVVMTEKQELRELLR